MDKEAIKTMIADYRAGQGSPENRARFEYWFHHLGLGDPSRLSADELESMSHRAWKYIRSRLDPVSRVVHLRMAAAAVLLLVGVGFYFYLRPSVPDVNRVPTLTLPDGRVIALNRQKAGIISGISELIYTDGSSIASISPQDRANPNLRYKVSTPRGAGYFVKLSDGTSVWLSAASSLTYPPSFTDSNRVVELKGEAYFDVKRDTRLFHVISAGQQVDAIKAAFNVYAYPEDAISQVTLLAGNLLVRDFKAKPDSTKTGYPFKPNLTPGQQFVISGKGTYIRTVNTADALAWRQGTIIFDNVDMAGMLRILQRWYNVKVVYEGQLPNKRITGEIKRTKDLNLVLRLLNEASDLNFKLKNDTIVVGASTLKP